MDECKPLVRGLAQPNAPPVYAAIQNAAGKVEHDVFLHRSADADASDGIGNGGGDAFPPAVLFADLPAVRPEHTVALMSWHAEPCFPETS